MSPDVRVIAGAYKGRRLASPTWAGLRPTSDRLRETLFNVLAHGHGHAADGARVLDLFAGTGAMAFEALSRGAAFALLVDDGAEARGLIRENQMALGLAGYSRIFRRDATRLGPITGMAPFDLVFCDPPYRKGLGEKALASAREGGWLASEALVVLEEAADAQITLPDGFEELDRRDYGETQVRILRVV